MTTNNSLSVLSDTELLIEVKRLAASERQATADLIRSLAEVKARGLHLAMGFSSMFGYCTQVLHLSEHAAYARIAAAKAATLYPLVMDLLIEGAITLTTVTILGRHLTAENHAVLLESARHKSKADVEMLVATLHPQPDVPSSVRKLPAPKRHEAATAPLISEVTEASADATAIDAPSSGPRAAAPRQPGSSTTTAFRSPMAGRRLSTTSSCAARRTTPTKPSGGSVRCSYGKPAARGLPAEAPRTKVGELGLDQVPLRQDG